MQYTGLITKRLLNKALSIAQIAEAIANNFLRNNWTIMGE